MALKQCIAVVSFVISTSHLWCSWKLYPLSHSCLHSASHPFLSIPPPCFEFLLLFSPFIRFFALFSFLFLLWWFFFSYSPSPPSPLLSLPLTPSYPFSSFSYSFPSSNRLSAFADEVQGLDQYAIRKFGEAFDVVPRTLAENSGGDPTTSMHTLHGSHIAPGTGNNFSYFFLFSTLWTICFAYLNLSTRTSLCFI